MTQNKATSQNMNSLFFVNKTSDLIATTRAVGGIQNNYTKFETGKIDIVLYHRALLFAFTGVEFSQDH